MQNIFSKALIVDDSKSIQEYLYVLLKDMGIEYVSLATSGKKALDEMHSSNMPYQLILCDINMPEMDGLEFMRHLGEENYTGYIVLISGEHARILESTEHLAKAHNLNVIGAIKKPVTPENLDEMLKQVGAIQSETQSFNNIKFSRQELMRAIHQDELLVYFQPKIEIATREVIGAEALVRWNHPEMGVLGADAFIPLLEEYKLIDETTDVVMEKALMFQRLFSQHEVDFKIAVNLSVDCLDRLELPELVVARVAYESISPGSLILEVTESRLMQSLKEPLEILTRLRLKGIGLSIDDFGTGYSSLEKLQNFPFAELKIDKIFVTGASTNVASRAIIESSVDLARKLDMTVVAEGVETEEDWKLVEQLGCDIIQGFYVAQPMPATEFIEWMNDWQSQHLLASDS